MKGFIARGATLFKEFLTVFPPVFFLISLTRYFLAIHSTFFPVVA